MNVLPYLMFDGRCEEAIEFYKKAVGAEVTMMMRFDEAPAQPGGGTVPPDRAKKIMHSTFTIGGSRVLASDGECKGAPNFTGVSLTIEVSSAADAERVFAGLAEGGTVTMPLSQTFWSPKFGMLTDMFGVSWIIHFVA